MKKECLETIENQIRDNNPKSTKKAYRKMIDEKINEENAKEVLAAFLELMIRRMVAGNTTFNEKQWNGELETIVNLILNDIQGQKIQEYQLEKNIARSRKEVGIIPNGYEEAYFWELNGIETTLYSYHCIYAITSRDAKKILLQVINHLYGILHHQSIDFFTDEDKRIYLMSKFLELKCNPYISHYVRQVVEEQIEVTHENDFEIFQPILKCLEKIYRSIEFWDKQFGQNGYFSFLKSVEESLNECDPYSIYTNTTILKR